MGRVSRTHESAYSQVFPRLYSQVLTSTMYSCSALFPPFMGQLPAPSQVLPPPFLQQLPPAPSHRSWGSCHPHPRSFPHPSCTSCHHPLPTTLGAAAIPIPGPSPTFHAAATSLFPPVTRQLPIPFHGPPHSSCCIKCTPPCSSSWCMAHAALP